jgi:hypothetical protein
MTGVVRTYPDVRPNLVSGHVVTFEGSDMLSKAIRFFAPGGSHTAMVLRLSDCTDTVFLIEALEHGPTLTRMSRRISNYRGRVHIQMPDLTKRQQQAITAMALRLLGARVGYDYRSLFRNIRSRVALNMRQGFCSETAQYLLTMAGVMTPHEGAMTPGELRQSLGHEVTLAAYTADCESVDMGVI